MERTSLRVVRIISESSPVSQRPAASVSSMPRRSLQTPSWSSWARRPRSCSMPSSLARMFSTSIFRRRARRYIISRSEAIITPAVMRAMIVSRRDFSACRLAMASSFFGGMIADVQVGDLIVDVALVDAVGNGDGCLVGFIHFSMSPSPL